MSAHESEWTLRRLHAGELPSPDAARARAHVAACTVCGDTLKGFADTQARFEEEVPFERFEAGVDRALERQRRRETRNDAPSPWVRALFAVAATVLVVVLARPLLEPGPKGTERVEATEPRNRVKGGAVAELRIGGGEGPQRTASVDAPEPLQPGDRVRLGYTADTRQYVAAVSVDAAGEVTPLYPEDGESLPVEPGAGTHWLPGGLEFTGAGAERVVLVLTNAPLTVDALREAARRAFEAGGRDVTRMPALDVPGDQTQWTLLKP